jgi:penicillin-binding protein 1C
VSEEVSSIVSSILSDPQARRKEFGADGLMRLPVQTAVKTGTSSDYRDAWAIGYSANFTVGVWMGNLNRSSMYEISGARGPALVLRSVFAELGRRKEARALFVSPKLTRRVVCPITGNLAGDTCPHLEEVFVEGTEPPLACRGEHHSGSGAQRMQAETASTAPSIVMPTPGLNFASDPRIPDALEAIAFEVRSPAAVTAVRWIVDGVQVGETTDGSLKYRWLLQEGSHSMYAQVKDSRSAEYIDTERVSFWVR